MSYATRRADCCWFSVVRQALMYLCDAGFGLYLLGIKGSGATPCCDRGAGRSPPSRPPSRRGVGWVFEGSEIYYDARRDDGLANRQVAGADPFRSLPVHRSESPTGYSSAGCSPAEPASASPVTENTSSIPIRRGNQMRCSSRRRPALGCGARARRIRRQPECHLYFARPVSFLSCADISVN